MSQFGLEVILQLMLGNDDTIMVGNSVIIGVRNIDVKKIKPQLEVGNIVTFGTDVTPQKCDVGA